MAEKNKFWGASSSSESEAGSDDEAKVEAKATQRQMGGTHHFIIDSDTESEDEGRVVRSAKDKRWGEMRAAIKSLIHLLEINDWNGIAQGASEQCGPLLARSGGAPGVRGVLGCRREPPSCAQLLAAR